MEVGSHACRASRGAHNKRNNGHVFFCSVMRRMYHAAEFCGAVSKDITLLFPPNAGYTAILELSPAVTFYNSFSLLIML